MKRYRTSLQISASADRVWRVLTEVLPQGPAPFGVLRIVGHLALNNRIKLWSEVAPNRTFVLTVTGFEPPNRMVWRGGMPFGLFTGVRTFQVTGGNDTTQFEMQEVFSGLLSGLILKSMPDLTPSFEKFANALKEKAETHE